MAILVDELREYPDVTLPFTVWCHMASDRHFDELHAFAARLGLRRAWFQRDHYDLPAHGRAAAVALGAEQVRAAARAHARGPALAPRAGFPGPAALPAGGAGGDRRPVRSGQVDACGARRG